MLSKPSFIGHRSSVLKSMRKVKRKLFERANPTYKTLDSKHGFQKPRGGLLR